MNKIKNILDKIIEYFCIFVLGLMTCLVTWQVITRYFFNNPSVITEQLSQYLFVWLVLFGSAYVFGKREHMQITFIRDLFNEKKRKILDIIQEIIILIFVLIVMTWGGYLSAIKQMSQLDAALQIPIGYIYLAIPVSGLIVVIYSIYNIKNILKKKN